MTLLTVVVLTPASLAISSIVTMVIPQNSVKSDFSLEHFTFNVPICQQENAKYSKEKQCSGF